MEEKACACLSDSQLKSFKRTFEHFDADKDQKISKPAEFRRALKSLGILPTPEEFEAMCQSTPGNTIDVLDFISVIYYFLRGADTPEELIRAFAVFDRDGQGTIPITTAKQILANLKHPIPERQADEVLAKLDVRGLIRYEDLIRELRPH